MFKRKFVNILAFEAKNNSLKQGNLLKKNSNSCMLHMYTGGRTCQNDNVMKWKHFLCSSVNSPHKAQWCRALMFSMICTWTKGNKRDTSDLRQRCTHYDVTNEEILLQRHPSHQNWGNAMFQLFQIWSSQIGMSTAHLFWYFWAGT